MAGSGSRLPLAGTRPNPGRMRTTMRSGGHRSGPQREPLSARVCDVATLVFASFTVCCHAVVALGGSFAHLLTVLAVAVAAGLLVVAARRFGPVAASSRATGDGAGSRAAPAPLREQGAGLSLPVRLVGTGLGLAIVGVYVWTGSAVHLWLGSVALLSCAAAVLVVATPDPSPRVQSAASPSLERALFALALGAVVLVAVIQRYDHDTPFYVAIAAAAVDFPARELMLDPIHGIDGLGLHQPAHRIHTIELLSAVCAALTRTSAFVATQAFTTSIAAFLVPLAFARLFRELTPRAWLGSVAVVLCVLVVASGPNWYGNFAFVRMIHGKAVFVSVFLPLCWAYGLRFGRAPGRRRFALLCAVQIASVGCTSSALGVAPMAAGLGVACGVRLDRRAPLVLGLALASSLYVVVLGLSLVGDMGQVAATVEQPLRAGQRLEAAIAWTLSGGRLAAFAWGALLVAWALCGGLAQRFAILVPLVVLATVLNPFFEHEVQRFVTGPAYRRAMWSLPLPVLMTLVLTAPRWLVPAHRFVGPTLVALAVGAYAVLVPSHYGLSEENRVTLGAPRLKVDPSEYAAAVRLAALVPADAAVLAPQSVALWLPSLQRHPKVLYAREPYLARIRSTFGPEEAEVRMRLSEAVSAGSDVERRTRQSDGYRRRRALGMTEPFFRRKLREYDVRAVSLNERAPLALRVRRALEQEGFTRVGAGDGYEEWALSSPPGARR